MTLILTVVHIMVAIGLILVVLLQRNSGDMGGAFGGTSQSLFGAQGSGDFLSRTTAVLATVFMVTSLTLAFFSNKDSRDISVMEQLATTAADGTPPVPGATPPPVPSTGDAQPAAAPAAAVAVPTEKPIPIPVEEPQPAASATPAKPAAAASTKPAAPTAPAAPAKPAASAAPTAPAAASAASKPN